MRPKATIFLFSGVFALIVLAIFSTLLPGSLNKLRSDIIQDWEREGAPLQGIRADIQSMRSVLTRSGILESTNSHRAHYSLAALNENHQLTLAAELKLQDMIEKQYFAHYSPEGDGVSVLADIVGYEYILIGENLALGNYQDDSVLVQAWMDSPGHRANILNPRYSEIGIAVARDFFENNIVWLAVQIFGLPLSACPSLDQALQPQINANEAEIARLKSELELKEEEIENTRPRWGPEYNRKVEAYNELVDQINSLIEQTSFLVNQYNVEIARINECMQKGP